MDDNQKRQLVDRLNNSKNILIAPSSSAGFDALASGLALYLSIRKLGKSASIVANQPTVGDAKSLYGVDNIGKAQAEPDLVIGVNNALDTVDKVTYFLDGEKLKIRIHALPSSRGVKKEDIIYEQASFNPDTIITVGFESLEELKKEAIFEQINSSKIFIISINANETNQKFAQVEVVYPETATLSETTTYFIRELSLPFDEDIAFNLYTGIKTATNMFNARLAKQSSFEAAKYLVKSGAGLASFARTDSKTTPYSSRSISEHSPNEIDEVPGENLNKFQNFPYPQQVQARSSQKIEPAKKSEPLPSPLYDEQAANPHPEEIERKERAKNSWLKPPKIYRGSKSFDSES